jgi:nucleoside-diphosphate-sugar epimerase
VAVDVLVTGGAGVLGRHICSQLLETQFTVYSSGRVAGAKVDIQWDLACQDAPAVDCTPAVVVHAAAKVGRLGQSLTEADTLVEVNVGGMLRVVRWCAEKGVEKLILASGALVYGQWAESPKKESDPVAPAAAGPYAVSKWCSEQVARLVEQAGCKLSILRLSSLYGVEYDRGLVQRMLRQGRETGKIDLGPPFEDAFDLLWVADAARTVCKTIEFDQGGMWNVGGGSLTTIRELAETCAEAVGVPVVMSGADSRSRRILNWVDDRKARAELGHVNNTEVRSGVRQIVEGLADRD